MSRKKVIEIEHVNFAYDSNLVLEDVNLTIAEKEFVCVIGPNGGGKTTLLKIILGLLEPKGGTVRVFGGPAVNARTLIGYVPQFVQFDPQFPVTVMDVVMMGTLGITTGGRRQARRNAHAALDEVGLSDMSRRPLAELSGGQRQRVFLARALAANPSALLLDEPTSHLDLQVEMELVSLLAELNKRMTVVMVSHDIGFVSPLVESVVCVKRKVVVHPTSRITGEIIHELYGEQVQMVRHDHRCAEDGHEWTSS